MKGITKTVVFTMVCSAFILIIGCEPESKTTDVKKERLFSAENIELKKQIDDLKKTQIKELAAKEVQLADCQKENAVISKQAQEETSKALDNEITNMLMEDSKRLAAENEELKAQIEELKKLPADKQE
jgi:hypothetical protein